MSGREELIARTRGYLWDAWQTSSEDMGSEAGATLHGLGMLVPEGGAAALDRLRMLLNAAPAELSEAQVDALSDAGNRALNDYYHERQCACSDWPTRCISGSYSPGCWDTDAFAIGAAALVGAWESLRAPAGAASPPSVLESEPAALLAEMVGDARPARVGLLLELGASVRDRLAHDHGSQREDWYCMNLAAYMGERMGPVLRRLLNSEAEAARLRARVAELEAERSQPAPVLPTKASSCTAPHSPSCSCANGEYRFCGADLGRSEFPFTCSRRVAHVGQCSPEPDSELLEDPHDSPLHQVHRLGRDLPPAVTS